MFIPRLGFIESMRVNWIMRSEHPLRLVPLFSKTDCEYVVDAIQEQFRKVSCFMKESSLCTQACFRLIPNQYLMNLFCRDSLFMNIKYYY